MKSKIILLAALILVAACNKLDPASSPEPTVLRFKAEAPVPVNTKMTSEVDVDGLKFAWENDDVLCLNFKYNGNYYPVDAAIDPSTISPSGKCAEFTVTLPSEIPSDATFDVFAIYQKDGSGREWDPTTKNLFHFVSTEEHGTTLNNPGSLGTSIMRPALGSEQKNVTASTLASFSLSHLGWVMCIHFRNETTSDINAPEEIRFSSTESNLFADEYDWPSGPVLGHPVCSVLVQKGFGGSGSPWAGTKIASWDEQVYYRWICSDNSLPELHVAVYPPNSSQSRSTDLPARTVTPGNVYHVYLNWETTKLTTGK